MANKDKRQMIFRRFADQLNLLKANGFLPGITLQHDLTYICPMCLRQFSMADLETGAPNMLTLEHAPPESVGGKGVALTCKQCNSIAGHEVDFHLGERLREIESRSFLPNTSMQVRATNNGLTVQATVHVQADGTMKMTHSETNNHLAKIEAFADAVDPVTNPAVQLEYRKTKTTFRGFEMGLLKTAYILAFAKYGYSFILDGVYDVVRAQLRQPEFDLYPQHFWLSDLPEFRQHQGVLFCTTPIAECLLSVFHLSPSERAYYYGVCLPIPLSNLELSCRTLYNMRHGGAVDFSKPNPGIDCLFDLEEIKANHRWFRDIRWSKITLNSTQNVPTAMNYLRHPIRKGEIKQSRKSNRIKTGAVILAHACSPCPDP